MSCIASFPRPSLACALQLLRAFRTAEVPVQEITLRLISLAGGVVSNSSFKGVEDAALCFEGGITIPADEISDSVWDSVDLAVSVLSANGISLDDEDISVSLDTEGKIIEILLPILLPIAIDLLRAWLRKRQGR
jgi:hypothetical protein